MEKHEYINDILILYILLELDQCKSEVDSDVRMCMVNPRAITKKPKEKNP